MTLRKQRLTVTVDPALVEAGNHAVSAGRATSLSSWVNDALSAQAVRDGQLRVLSEAIVDFERRCGEITREEIEAQQRADREAAVVVRGQRNHSREEKTSPRPGAGAA
jgi:hypothetical protein